MRVCIKLLASCVFIAFLSWVIGVEPKKSQRSHFELKLHKELFDNYSSEVHPAPNVSSQVVMVVFDVQVIRVLQVNERDQYVEVYLWINQYWNNPMLRWDPKEYGGIQDIHINADKVWVPDIVLYNNVDTSAKIAGGLEAYKSKINIFFDGNNTWLNPVVFKSICRLDVSYFPFDDQCCSLKFGSWAFDGGKIDMRPSRGTSQVNDYYIKNGEWELLTVFAERRAQHYQCCEHPFVDVTVHLRLRREALNYALNLIVPCALLSSLVFLGYILPPESGERIGLTVALLLSVTVFQQMSSQIMPSYDFPYLAQYYWATILQTGLSLVVTTVILNFYHRHHRRMHWLLKKILLEWISKVIFCTHKGAKALDESYSESDFENLFCSPPDINIKDSFDEEEKPDIQEANGDHTPKRSLLKKTFRNNKLQNNNGVTNGGLGLTDMSQYTPNTRRRMLQTAFRTNIRKITTALMDEQCIESRQALEKRRNEELARRQKDWLKAARVLDRLFLILSFLTFIITAAAIFLRAPRFWGESSC